MRFINKLFDKIYLLLTDCDGMCNHCNIELKNKCESYKTSEK